MVRFRYRKKPESPIKIILSLCLFASVVAVFFLGIGTLSETATDKEKKSLENAIARDIAYCYATEGTYPESLAYIKENYGLTYNDDKFFVDYTPRGENILPDVTVILLEEGK
ncbi:MAG: hypothetical protein ACI4KL_01910 [Lentihominibacter sp.]